LCPSGRHLVALASRQSGNGCPPCPLRRTGRADVTSPAAVEGRITRLLRTDARLTGAGRERCAGIRPGGTAMGPCGWQRGSVSETFQPARSPHTTEGSPDPSTLSTTSLGITPGPWLGLPHVRSEDPGVTG